MGSDSSEASHPSPASQLLNHYATVIYIPDPLGGFLDDLRRELVPTYRPHAHVSILPPRPLAGAEWEAREQMHELAAGSAPFEIESAELALFPVTEVVYLEVSAGHAELRRLHQALNTGALAWQEPYVYHPHVTLAQDIEHGDLARIHALALRRWDEYPGPRRFQAARMTFVRNRPGNIWTDVGECEFGAVIAK
jgi:2'-5' RNA ligase